MITAHRGSSVIAWIAVACLLAMQPACDKADEHPKLPAKVHLSEKAIAILSGATRVEVFRIDSLGNEKPTTQPAEHVGLYQVIRKGKSQDQEFARRSAALLLDSKTYANFYTQCFDPGVALRFWKGKESADVFICFHCENLVIETTGTKDGSSFSFHGTNGQASLTKLAKQAFPDDPEIQKLPE